MNKAEIMAMAAGPEIDALVHVHVMGQKCYHLNRRPVNPSTARHQNAAKDICEDCGLRTYVSDFHHAQKGYSRNIVSAQKVVEKLVGDERDWRQFVLAFVELLPGNPFTGQVILAALDPLFICQVALISKLRSNWHAQEKEIKEDDCITKVKLQVEGEWLEAELCDQDKKPLPLPHEVKAGERYFVVAKKGELNNG